MTINLAVSNLQDAQILQQVLDHLHEWELQWDMEFSPSKCVFIHVARARIPVPSEYLLHGHILKSVGGTKYLGVEISDSLSFNNHIQKKCTSASRSLGFIKCDIRTKSPANREMVNKTLVYPLVEYSSSVWSSNTHNNIYKIEMAQRRAARWKLNSYTRQAGVTEMLTHLGWCSFEQRRNDSQLCLFYKVIHRLVAVNLPPYVEHSTRISQKNSHSLVYRQIHIRVDYY